MINYSTKSIFRQNQQFLTVSERWLIYSIDLMATPKDGYAHTSLFSTVKKFDEIQY